MSQQEDIVKLLSEIKELLAPISAHFETEYIVTKQKQIEELLSTDTKRKIYALLFDSKKLSQTDIAKFANTTQPTVSRLISSLLEVGLIQKDVDENGKDFYIEKFRLPNKLEAKNGKPTESQ